MVVAHAFNPSTQEAEAGGSPWVQVQSGLQSKFQDSQSSYTEKPCLKNPCVYAYFACMYVCEWLALVWREEGWS